MKTNNKNNGYIKLKINDIKDGTTSVYSIISKHYFNKKQLRARGWTESILSKLMPEWDDEYRYPRHTNSAKLFKKSRVYGIERSKKWKELHTKSLAYLKARGLPPTPTPSISSRSYGTYTPHRNMRNYNN